MEERSSTPVDSKVMAGNDHPMAETECPTCAQSFKRLGLHTPHCKGIQKEEVVVQADKHPSDESCIAIASLESPENESPTSQTKCLTCGKSFKCLGMHSPHCKGVQEDKNMDQTDALSSEESFVPNALPSKPEDECPNTETECPTCGKSFKRLGLHSPSCKGIRKGKAMAQMEEQPSDSEDSSVPTCSPGKPEDECSKTETECPTCRKSFKRLGLHTPHCKGIRNTIATEETAELLSNSEDSSVLTCSPEKPEDECSKTETECPTCAKSFKRLGLHSPHCKGIRNTIATEETAELLSNSEDSSVPICSPGKPEDECPQTEKECPTCGKSFKRLGLHSPHCKGIRNTKVTEETVELFSNSEDSSVLTCSPEKPEDECSKTETECPTCAKSFKRLGLHSPHCKGIRNTIATEETAELLSNSEDSSVPICSPGKPEDECPQTEKECPTCGKSFKRLGLHSPHCKGIRNTKVTEETVELFSNSEDSSVPICSPEKPEDECPQTEKECPTCGKRFKRLGLHSPHCKGIRNTKFTQETVELFSNSEDSSVPTCSPGKPEDECPQTEKECPTCGKRFKRLGLHTPHCKGIRNTKVKEETVELFSNSEDSSVPICSPEKPEDECPQTEKECPTCGKSFKRLGLHSPHCKGVRNTKVTEETVELFSNSEDSSVPICSPEKPEDECPQTEKECPTCGKSFKRLGLHSPHCKGIRNTKVKEETVELFSNSEDSSVPICSPEKPEDECPQTEKECPTCGKSFKRLGLHSPNCKGIRKGKAMAQMEEQPSDSEDSSVPTCSPGKPEDECSKTETECPTCRKSFKRLGLHTPHCKGMRNTIATEETAELLSNSEDSSVLTCSPEKPEDECSKTETECPTCAKSFKRLGLHSPHCKGIRNTIATEETAELLSNSEDSSVPICSPGKPEDECPQTEKECPTSGKSFKRLGLHSPHCKGIRNTKVTEETVELFSNSEDSSVPICSPEKPEDECPQTEKECPTCGKRFKRLGLHTPHCKGIRNTKFTQETVELFSNSEDSSVPTCSPGKPEDECPQTEKECPTCGKRFKRLGLHTPHCKGIRNTKVKEETVELFSNSEDSSVPICSPEKPEDECPQTEKECPTCGKSFKRLGLHSPHCKGVRNTKVTEETVELFSNSEDSSVPICSPEKPEDECPQTEKECPTCGKSFKRLGLHSPHCKGIRNTKVKEETVELFSNSEDSSVPICSPEKPEDEYPQTEKECPACGKSFKRLGLHSPHCKGIRNTKVTEETVELFSNSEDSSVPICSPEKPEDECPTTEKECPTCGKSFKRLGLHTPHCKGIRNTKVTEETVELFSNSEDSSVPICSPGKPKDECPKTEKECPTCGKRFKRLGLHMPHCKGTQKESIHKGEERYLNSEESCIPIAQPGKYDGESINGELKLERGAPDTTDEVVESCDECKMLKQSGVEHLCIPIYTKIPPIPVDQKFSPDPKAELDKLIEEVKLEPAEVSEGAQFIKELNEKFVNSLNNLDRFFQWNLITSGSYYEKVKVCRPNEYDLMIVTSFSCHVDFGTTGEPYCSVELRGPRKSELSQFLTDGKWLSPKALKNHLINLIPDALRDFREGRRFTLRQSKKSPAITLTCRKDTYKKGKPDHIIYEVDLVPAIRLPQFPPCVKWPSALCSERSMFAVAKTSPVEQESEANNDRLWRMSFSDVEKYLVLHADGGLGTYRKWVLKILKTILEKAKEKYSIKTISSYHIKSFMLHQYYEVWPNPESWAKSYFRTRLLHAIDQFQKVLKQRTLTHFFLRNVNLTKDLEDDDIECFCRVLEEWKATI